ncbi:MAG TPA: 7-cyano-7-deazaguanine synthase QueC [Thermodesulfovibrionales bacterium]|nr:7-cyano-7-deazaguanine synthase QueC [Thermodesulfovibrionales bacterium]
MKRRKAVVLLSGGIDSSTTLAVAKSDGYELYALSFDYNQRHKKELESARLIASAVKVKKHLIIHFDLRDIGGSALTSDMQVPKSVIRRRGETETQRDEHILSDSPSHRLSVSGDIPVTYVPARNTIFLSFALGWAEVLEAEDIFIGANAIDYSGYPDCRPEYLWAFEKMANLATKASVEGKLRFAIKAPLILMKKSEIMKKGIELGLDYSLTWSCYDPQPATTRVQSSKFKVQSYKEKNSKLRTSDSELIPCGLCDSCVIRAEGFREAGLKDPLLEHKGTRV